jgi:hypothetical protein
VIHNLTFLDMAIQNAMDFHRIEVMETSTRNKNVVYSGTIIIFFSTNFLIKASVGACPVSKKYSKVRIEKYMFFFVRDVYFRFKSELLKRKIE